ncbi:TonB-dependent receptor plug domain-containing protein, partial [Acinetobacter sp.]
MMNFTARPLAVAVFALMAGTAYANENEKPTDSERVVLPTIVVTASGYEQKLKDAPASVTVITAQDLKDKRINSVADALVDVEGVDISPMAGKTGGLNIRIRGMDSEYT